MFLLCPPQKLSVATGLLESLPLHHLMPVIDDMENIRKSQVYPIDGN